MSEASISRAEKKIERLTEMVGCSEDGELFIKQCLDPFNDQPRRAVGFPDLITGNSVIQVVKQSKTISIGASPQDVHIFMDTLDTSAFITANMGKTGYTAAIETTAVGGVNTYVRGGVVIRKGAVGATLATPSTIDHIPLPSAYTNSGTTRVIAKAFEVHNVTNQLNVGGGVTVYRDTGPTALANTRTFNLFAAGSETISISQTSHGLTPVAETLAAVTRIPGSLSWEAKDGCYVVAIMASQTNNPTDENVVHLNFTDSSNAAGQWYDNSIVGVAGQPPVIYSDSRKMMSPFFLCGAYFTGLPANSELKIDTIYYLERFPDNTNADLVVLAQPSAYYDPVAMELYSRAAHRLQHGVKVSENADGDWIKSIADVLGTFGVPGMPLVKGAVDVWNIVKGRNEPRIVHTKPGVAHGTRDNHPRDYIPMPVEMRPKLTTAIRPKALPSNVQLTKKKKKPDENKKKNGNKPVVKKQ